MESELNNLPLVSIVVTTRNESHNIENCLLSIRCQSYDKIELIVVDNHSTDDTKVLAVPYANLVVDWGPERSAQRNHGLLYLSKGEILGYIDADMILGPDVVTDAVDTILSGAVGTYVPEIVLGTSFLSKVRRFERGFYDATPIDAVRFFERTPFVAIGGFDEALFREGSGEDWDLDLGLMQCGTLASVERSKPSADISDWPLAETCRQLGVWPIVRNAIFHNESRIELRRYLGKKSYYARGFTGYREKWGTNNPRIQKQFGFAYRYWYVFVEETKWRELIAHPILATSMFSLRILVGAAYARQLLLEKWRK